MSKSPFYRVYIKNTDSDVTEMVTSLRYEDSLKADDFVEIKMDRVKIDFLDSGDISKGNEIIFEYGFIGGKRSGQRYAVIKNIDYTYGNSVNVTIKAHDKGTWMKKLTSVQIYEGKTASEIVKSIAAMFNMDAVIDDTEKKYETLSQGGKTFYDLCKYLANKEGYVKEDKVFGNKVSSAEVELNKQVQDKYGIANICTLVKSPAGLKSVEFQAKQKAAYPFLDNGLSVALEKALQLSRVSNVGKTYIKGAYEFFVRGNTLHFVKRDLSVESKRLYTYGDPDGSVVSFRPKTSEKGNGSGASSSVANYNIDPETNEIIESKTDNSNTTETGLGEELLNFDVFGELIDSINIDKSLISGSTNFSTGETKEDIDKKGGASKLNSGKKEVTADLVVELDPDVNAGDVITMAGVAQIHAGNWRVEKATHDIISSPAQTTLSLVKNAGKNGQGGSTGSKTNETVGDNSNNVDAEKDLDRIYFDQDGNEIGTKEKGYGLNSEGGIFNANTKVNNN